MEYKLIRSKRRTVALQVNPDLTVVVRAPYRMPQRDIDEFLNKNREWLKGALQRTEEKKRREDAVCLREAELKNAAKEYLPKRTAYWAEIMGVSPAGVRITSAKTRFGSCSPKNRICYSWRLMAYPPEAVDYVVVHELAHILQKNHSKKFYAVVQTYLPDWKERKRELQNK